MILFLTNLAPVGRSCTAQGWSKAIEPGMTRPRRERDNPKGTWVTRVETQGHRKPCCGWISAQCMNTTNSQRPALSTTPTESLATVQSAVSCQPASVSAQKLLVSSIHSCTGRLRSGWLQAHPGEDHALSICSESSASALLRLQKLCVPCLLA